MSIMTIGIDLAKNVFAVHGMGENGKTMLNKPADGDEVRHPLPRKRQTGQERCGGCGGYHQCLILQKLFNFQRDAATGLIANGCRKIA